MSRPDDLYRELADWMSDGPSVVADRVIDGALTTIDHTPQLRRPRVPWRLPDMPFSYRIALVAMLVLATVGSTLVVGRLALDQAAGREIIVAQDGSGDARTITEALDLAADGDTILVRPGRYAESLTITRDITLRGDGDPSAVVIDFSTDGGPVTEMPGVGEALPSLPYGIVLDGSDATISDLSIHGSYPGAAFKIVGGAPIVERVAITAEQPSAGEAYDFRTSFGIYEGSTATIRDSAWDGYIKISSASPIVEHNMVSNGNRQQGEWLTAEFPNSDPIVRGNTFVGGSSVVFCCGARGTVEDNDVVGGFVSMESGADPVVRGNRIRVSGEAGCVSCDEFGIEVNSYPWDSESIGVTGAGLQEMTPVIADNEITGMLVGIRIRGLGANPSVQGNTVRDGGAGIVIDSRATPTLERNKVCGNGTDLMVAGRAVAELDGVTVCAVPPSTSAAP